MLGAGVEVAVIIIGYGDYACADGDVLSLKAFGITGAIPFFMVRADDIADGIKAGNILQHAGACDAVTFINRLFARRKKRQLSQNNIGYGKLTDIMQQRCCFYLRNLAGRQTELSGSAGRIIGNLLTVQINFPVFNFQHS